MGDQCKWIERAIKAILEIFRAIIEKTPMVIQHNLCEGVPVLASTKADQKLITAHPRQEGFTATPAEPAILSE
jgi:hypothetical protein